MLTKKHTTGSCKTPPLTDIGINDAANYLLLSASCDIRVRAYSTPTGITVHEELECKCSRDSHFATTDFCTLHTLHHMYSA